MIKEIINSVLFWAQATVVGILYMVIIGLFPIAIFYNLFLPHGVISVLLLGSMIISMDMFRGLFTFQSFFSLVEDLSYYFYQIK